MAVSHPNNIDPQPKRRKDKNNPYGIFTTDIDTAHPRYDLSFVDGSGVNQYVEIGKARANPLDVLFQGLCPSLHLQPERF